MSLYTIQFVFLRIIPKEEVVENLHIDNKESQINAKRFKSLGNLITNISKKPQSRRKK